MKLINKIANFVAFISRWESSLQNGVTLTEYGPELSLGDVVVDADPGPIAPLSTLDVGNATEERRDNFGLFGVVDDEQMSSFLLTLALRLCPRQADTVHLVLASQVPYLLVAFDHLWRWKHSKVKNSIPERKMEKNVFC